MNNAGSHENVKPRPESAGGLPPPPKRRVRGSNDETSDEPHIDLPDPIVVKDLAAALRQKPFRIVADVLELGQFASAVDAVDFETAARIAEKYGIHARRIA